VPELVLVSPAARARATAELAAEAGGWRAELRLVDALYDATLETVLGVLREHAVSAQSLGLVGHEPVLSALLARLVGGRPPSFPTAAMARVDLEELKELGPGSGALGWLVPPRLLDEAGDEG
jgi:phosphohistidine phosphatase